MSVNHNTALLRNVHETLVRSLDELSTRLASGEPGRRDPATGLKDGSLKDGAVKGSGDASSPVGAPRDVVAIAGQVAGNLAMVRCHAVARIAATLENAVKGLAAADRRGWTPAHVHVVAAAAIRVITALKRQVRHMVREEDVLPVTLWAPWDELGRAIGEPQARPEDLFEPNPQFDGQPFRTLDDAYLKDVAEGAIERFDAALRAWEEARDEGEALGAAKRISEVFDGLYALQHRKAYYIYWLVWRARLALAQLSNPDRLMSHRADWLQELEAAGVEMRKFANACRAPQHARLMGALAPIVATPWPESWGLGHPVLAELDQRLGLAGFWAAAAAARDSEANKAKNTFLGRRDDIVKSVRRLIRTAHLAFDGNKAKDVRDMRVALHDVLGKEDLLPSADATPLFDGLRRLIDIIDAAPAESSRANPVFSPAVSLEAAGLLILLEEVLDRPFPLTADIRDRLARQASRLDAAISGGPSALRDHAPVRWDPAYRQQKGREAVVQALAVLQGDLSAVEMAWLEVEKGESENPEEAIQDGSRQLLLASGVLLLLRYPAAAAIARAIGTRLGSFRPARSPGEDRAAIVDGLAALSGYITARRMGQTGAGQRLGEGAAALGLDLAGFIEEETANDPENLAFTTLPEAPLVRESSSPAPGSAPPAGGSGLPAVDMTEAVLDGLDAALDGLDDAAGGSMDDTSGGEGGPGEAPAALAPARECVSDGEPVSHGEHVSDEASVPGMVGDFDLFGEDATSSAASHHASGRGLVDDGLGESTAAIRDRDESGLEDAGLDEASGGQPDGDVSGGFGRDRDESGLEDAGLDEASGDQAAGGEPGLDESWRHGPLSPLPPSPELGARLRAGVVIDRFRDRDIAMCFIDEVESVLGQMEASRLALLKEPYDATAWSDLRRGYHTLKGSGRMAGYLAMGEVALWGEATVADRIARHVGMTPAAADWLARAGEIFAGWLANLKSCQRTPVDGREMAVLFDSLVAEAHERVPSLPQEDEDGFDDPVGDFEDIELLPALHVEAVAIHGSLPGLPASHPDGEGSGVLPAGEGSPVPDDEEAAWDAVFDAIEAVGSSIARLTQALVLLRQDRE